VEHEEATRVRRDGDGSEWRKIRTPALLVALVFGLVFLVALGSHRSLASASGGSHSLGLHVRSGDVTGVVVAVGSLALAALVFLVWVMWPGRRRKPEEPDQVFELPPIPWWEKAIALVFAFLPVAGIVTAIILLREHGRAVREAPSAPVGTVPPPRPPSGTSPLEPTVSGVDWWVYLVLAVAAVAVLVLLVLLWRRRPAWTPPATRPTPEPELREAIEDLLERLEREPDPRRAVIGAYVGMEQALAGAGHGRRPFEAPLEYLTRALAAVRLSRQAASRLTGLFQRARFSEHAVGQEMKAEAIEALVAVRGELEQRP
jgi:hypothetical protein